MSGIITVLTDYALILIIALHVMSAVVIPSIIRFAENLHHQLHLLRVVTCSDEAVHNNPERIH